MRNPTRILSNEGGRFSPVTGLRIYLLLRLSTRPAPFDYGQRRASDCLIALNFINRCGALAETKQHEVGSAAVATKKEAENRSLAACRAAGKTCTVAISVCSVK